MSLQKDSGPVFRLAADLRYRQALFMQRLTSQ